MEKTMILRVLRSMLVDWNDSERFKSKQIAEDNHTEFGFCSWLTHNTVSLENQTNIIDELKKDLENRYFHYELWYPIGFDNHYEETVFKNRIDHLNRTITRLETETTI